MQKRKMNWICALLAVVIVLYVLAGCGSNEAKESVKDTTQAQQSESAANSAAADKTYEYTWATWNNMDMDDEVYTKQWLEKTYNVKIKFVKIEPASWSEKINVILATGDIPDMIRGQDGSEVLAKYADQGVIAEIPLDTIKKYMPKYSEYVESLSPKQWNLGLFNGKNYGIPIPEWMGNYRNAIAWNTDWLKNVGIQKVPETLDEFEAAFTSFRNNDPDKDGKKDTYGLTSPGKAGPLYMFNEFFGAFGTAPYQFIEKDGKLVYGFTLDGTKETLKLLNKWYKNKLIDPEFITEEPRTDGNNDIAWKFSAGKVGYISNLDGTDHQWDNDAKISVKWLAAHPNALAYVYQDGDKNKPLLYTLPYTDLNSAPKESYVNGNPPVGPSGESGMPILGLSNKYIFFGKQMEKDEGKLAKLMTILEDVSSNKEAYIASTMGKEGEQWQWVESDKYGKFADFKTEYLQTPDASAKPRKYTGYFSTNPFWVSVKNQYMSYAAPRYAQRMQTLDIICTKGTIENMVKIPLPSQATYPDLNKMLDEFFIKAIIGDVNIDTDFDKVVKAWKENGGDVLTKEANDWFSTVK